MLNIVTVCGAGVGSSMMMRLYAQQSLSEEGIEANVGGGRHWFCQSRCL